jgi:phage-related baseplate assembly protein
MSETLPRWNLPETEFLTTDAAKIESEIITRYEELTGRTLAAGDPVRLFLLSIAAIIIQQRTEVNIAAQQNLLSYAQGQYLDALGAYLSVERLAESHAKTTIRFTLAEALANVYQIPSGFEVTNGIVTFATDDVLEIPSGTLSGEVTATCTTSGAEGNDYLAGQISTIVTPMTFLASASNITITTGGADAESDSEYAERIRLAPNSFSVAGPKKAYIYHAKSVSSAVIDVSVVSPTPGEVDVYPLLEGGVLPSEEVLEQIYDYLSSDEIRPLTDYVQVLSPEAYEYEINVHYWILEEDKTKSQTIQKAVEEAVENYRLWQQSKIGRDIVPAKLIAGVIQAGAARIDNATMTPANFVLMPGNTVAQCTKVNIVYEGYKEE